MEQRERLTSKIEVTSKFLIAMALIMETNPEAPSFDMDKIQAAVTAELKKVGISPKEMTTNLSKISELSKILGLLTQTVALLEQLGQMR